MFKINSKIFYGFYSLETQKHKKMFARAFAKILKRNIFLRSTWCNHKTLRNFMPWQHKKIPDDILFFFVCKSLLHITSLVASWLQWLLLWWCFGRSFHYLILLQYNFCFSSCHCQGPIHFECVCFVCEELLSRLSSLSARAVWVCVCKRFSLVMWLTIVNNTFSMEMNRIMKAKDKFHRNDG